MYKERISNFELLRIIAMFLVLIGSCRLFFTRYSDSAAMHG